MGHCPIGSPLDRTAVVLAALRSLPGTAVLAFDRERRIALAGGHLLFDQGWDPSALVGLRVDEVLAPAGDARLTEAVEAALAGRRSTLDHVSLAGDALAVDVGPLCDAEDRRIGGVAVLRPETEDRAARERNQQLAEHASDLVSLERADGTIAWVSPSASAVLGHAPDALVGRRFAELAHPEDRDAGGDRFLQRLRHADGGWRWLETTSAPIPAGGDDGPLTRRSRRDVTAGVEAQAALREARLQLERSNEDLMRVAAVAAHDIGAPISALHFELDRLAAAGTEGLDRARALAGQMESLVGAILTLARVEREPVAPEPIALDAVLEEVLVVLAPTIERHGARVDVRGPLPVVAAEVVQARQLLQNLIVNAMVHHPGPRPRITVSAEDGVLVVADDGAGIPVAEREAVFGLFAREGGGEGHGIGLAITRRVAERFGGRVWVEPAEPHGTRMCVGLPAARKEPGPGPLDVT